MAARIFHGVRKFCNARRSRYPFANLVQRNNRSVIRSGARFERMKIQFARIRFERGK